MPSFQNGTKSGMFIASFRSRCPVLVQEQGFPGSFLSFKKKQLLNPVGEEAATLFHFPLGVLHVCMPVHAGVRFSSVKPQRMLSSDAFAFISLKILPTVIQWHPLI